VIARWQHGFDVIHEVCPDKATVLLITHGTFIRTLADHHGINILGNFPLNGSVSYTGIPKLLKLLTKSSIRRY